MGSAPLDEPLDKLVLPVISEIVSAQLQVSGQQLFYFYYFIAQGFYCEWKSEQTAFNRLGVRGAGKGCSGRDIGVSGHQCLSALG